MNSRNVLTNQNIDQNIGVVVYCFWHLEKIPDICTWLGKVPAIRCQQWSKSLYV